MSYYNINLTQFSTSRLDTHDMRLYRRALQSYDWDDLYDIADEAHSPDLREIIRAKGRMLRHLDEYAAYGTV
ncbi:MAG: hypothetical protein K2O78_05300 [Muribaculaceae bacterium]|nr:hypothetical protein [Muribaculaceae bacterium]